MLENFSDAQITAALKDMEVQDNNTLRQEFVEGLRNGRPGNYKCLRIFLDKLQIEHQGILAQQITETLQIIGWGPISKMREQIFNGVTDKDPEGYSAFRKFLTKLADRAS